MTRIGQALLPMPVYVPDRWEYTFDGKELKILEEWDEMPDEVLENTKRMVTGLGFSVEEQQGVQGRCLLASVKMGQEEAICHCVAEFAGQASSLGLLSVSMPAKIYEELSKAKTQSK